MKIGQLWEPEKLNTTTLSKQQPKLRFYYTTPPQLWQVKEELYNGKRRKYTESLTIFNAATRIQAAIDMYYLIASDSGAYDEFTYDRFNLLWAELDIIFSSLKDLIPDNITYYEKDSN